MFPYRVNTGFSANRVTVIVKTEQNSVAVKPPSGMPFKSLRIRVPAKMAGKNN